jgi:hypothetical protein
MDNPRINKDGDRNWWENHQRHRTDGPAIEFADGGKAWYISSKRHRTDGPAIEYTSGNEWWLNGQRHRTDGPACEWSDGSKSWYLYDHFYLFDQWLDANSELTHEQKVMMKLQYG